MLFKRVAWVLLVLAAGLRGQGAPPLVGRWHSAVTSRGGIGSIIEFHGDGTVETSPGAVVPTPYRIENGQLVTASGTVNGPEQRMAMVWSGSNSVQFGPAPGVVLTRVGVGQDQVNPILGEWREVRDMGGKKLDASWIFYGDGRMLLLIPFLVQRGSYVASGGSVSMVIAGKTIRGAFSMKGDVLTLPRADGSGVSEFLRH